MKHMNTYTIHIPEMTNDNRANIMCNSYRFGTVNMLELAALSAEAEAKAKAKVARTGKPVIERANVGIYDMYTTSGQYLIEREVDWCTGRETGWWATFEIVEDGHRIQMDDFFRTLAEAKAFIATV